VAGSGIRASGVSSSENDAASSQHHGGSRVGSVARVAEGAEETRLIDGDDGDEEEDVYGARFVKTPVANVMIKKISPKNLAKIGVLGTKH
jgi:hypothetical protein